MFSHWITAKYLYDLLTSEPECVQVWDLRASEDFRRLHIPGAKKIEGQQLLPLVEEFNQDILIVVVGEESQLKNLVDHFLSYDNVIFLGDGLESWLSSGYPVQSLEGERMGS
ncbi:MAG: rhodanese-like domain-containing protein [Bdellovibrionales bacterium]|nr:rhodanese-like domain-containing protein [Bdellovibrionales bacterium]